MKSLLAIVTVTGIFSVTALAQQASTQSSRGQAVTVSPTTAPQGTDALSAQWVSVSAPNVGVMLAAIARPAGDGPFPTVLLLHGTHGFAPQYVQLAQELSRGGLIVVAACWFSGGVGEGSRFVSAPIGCPDAPAMPMAMTPEAFRTVDALVKAVRTLPGVRSERIGLVGHSRGAGATLNYLQQSSDVRAAVLDSSGYADELIAANVRVPILILHGTRDSPSSGGSAFTAVQRARNFEAALRREGKTVEAKFYERGEHNSLFSDVAQHDDEVRRMVTFLRRHLGG